MKNSERLIQVLIFFGGIAISLAAIRLAGGDRASFGDAEDYLLAAGRLVENAADYPGRSLYLPFFRPPLYPFLIASVWLVFPKSLLAVKLVQAVLFGASGVVVYRLAAALSPSRTAAVLSAAIFLTNPFFVMPTTDIQTETLHNFLFSAALLGLLLILKTDAATRKTVPGLLLAGAVFGLAALCRPSALPLALGLALGLFLLKRRARGFVKSLAFSAILVGGIFLTIAPWTLANYRRTGEIILINDASGYALWTGNHPGSLALYEKKFASADEYNRYADYVLQYAAEEKIAGWRETNDYERLSPKEREALWRREALANMRENPGVTAKLWLYKTWTFWRPYLNPTAYPAKAVLVSGIYLAALFLAAAAGAKIAWKDYNNRQAIILLGGLFGGATVLHALTVSMIRYRVPYVDTYLCVLAGIAAQVLAAKVRNILRDPNLN